MTEIVEMQHEKKGDICIVRFRGRLDSVTSHSVEEKVFSHIQEGERQLIFNLANVDYLSSAGMRVLLTVSKKLKTISGHLVLCEVSDNVMDVLKMSGFDHILDIVPTEQDAIKKLIPIRG